MRLTLPPHIGWPLLVVALLSISISASVYTLIAAGSGGGAQVVDDYYNRALHWDEERVVSSAATRLGWQMHVEVGRVSSGSLRAVKITVSDSTGAGVDGLAGTIHISRPHLAGTVAEIPLQAQDGEAGAYVQLLPVDAPGLWDFEMRARDGRDAVQMRVRVEVDNTAG